MKIIRHRSHLMASLKLGLWAAFVAIWLYGGILLIAISFGSFN